MRQWLHRGPPFTLPSRAPDSIRVSQRYVPYHSVRMCPRAMLVEMSGTPKNFFRAGALVRSNTSTIFETYGGVRTCRSGHTGGTKSEGLPLLPGEAYRSKGIEIANHTMCIR